MHRPFIRKISENRDIVKTFCTDLNNPFQIACREWYLYNNPQC